MSAEAKELFIHTIVRGIVGWDTIQSFRHVAKAGLPHAMMVVSAEHEAMLRPLAKEQDAFSTGRPFDSLRTDLTRQTLQMAQASVDAASLVFMHSIVDDALLNYCRVTALMRPKDCEHWIEREEGKFKLSEIRERGYEELFKDALERRLNKLENESLMVKADMLFRLCKPHGEFNEEYLYDRQKLSALDQQRHKITHGDALTLRASFPSTEEDLEYLLSTLRYFCRKVSEVYSLDVPKSLTP